MIYNTIAFILPIVYAAATLSNSEKVHAGFSIMNSYTDEDHAKVSNIDHDGNRVSEENQARKDTNNEHLNFKNDDFHWKGVLVGDKCWTGYVKVNGKCVEEY